MSPVVVVVNFISDRQYKNKDNLLTKQDTTLVIAVRGHQRSPWAHRAGGLFWWFHWDNLHNQTAPKIHTYEDSIKETFNHFSFKIWLKE